MRITTIIPAYNRAELIGETLRSVLEQDRAPDEVIVVDDGSSDGTPDVVAAHGKAVRLIRQANAGPGPARNTGFAASSGEIVHFMDSDDLASRNFYAVAAAAIEGGADFTYGPLLNVRFEGDTAYPADYLLQRHPLPSGEDPSTRVLTFGWAMVLQPCLVRRAAVERAGPYRTDLMPSEDREFLYRLLRQAGRLHHTDETLILYRVHPAGQISAEDDPRRLVDLARLVGIFQEELARRDDLGALAWRRFMRHKARLATALRRHEPEVSARLLRDAGLVDRLLAPVVESHAFRRVQGKLRRTFRDSAYPSSYGGAPVGPADLAKIVELGYRLGESPVRG